MSASDSEIKHSHSHSHSHSDSSSPTPGDETEPYTSDDTYYDEHDDTELACLTEA